MAIDLIGCQRYWLCPFGGSLSTLLPSLHQQNLHSMFHNASGPHAIGIEAGHGALPYMYITWKFNIEVCTSLRYAYACMGIWVHASSTV